MEDDSEVVVTLVIDEEDGSIEELNSKLLQLMSIKLENKKLLMNIFFIFRL